MNKEMPDCSKNSEDYGEEHIQIGDFTYTESSIIEMNKAQFNEVIQGIPEIQSILLRDMRRRGLTRKAVQKCRQRQNARLSELDLKKKELQEQLNTVVQHHDKANMDLMNAQQKYELVQNVIVQWLKSNPLVESTKAS